MMTGLLSLQTNPSASCREIEDFILASMAHLKRQGAVIGLSGGLDSAVTALLTVRSLGEAKVHLLHMPEKDSNPLHREHAERFAAHLGLDLDVFDITPMVRATRTYRILPLGLIPGPKLRTRVVEYGRKRLLEHDDERLLADRLEPEADSWIAKGNAYGTAKHRIRVVVIYQFADLRNLMVVGAANRTELLTGTFSQWGIDQCADIMPVIHLYRSQLEELAEYLQVPDYIRNKASDPDLLPVDLNKSRLLGGYRRADHILYNMENQVDREAIYGFYDRKIVDHLYSLFQLSTYMRETPYHL
jgi:NAD+ synthase